MDTSRSAAHQASAHHVVPGGAHTYAKGDDQWPEHLAPVIERGWGCRVQDLDGNTYVEWGSGLRAATLGHAYPPVVEAAARQMREGYGFVRPHRLEAQAAERLVELIPSAEMVKFGVNGSDATTAAVRLARACTGRDLVAVCRQHPFFSTDDWFMGTTPMRAGVPAAVRDLTLHFDYNDLDSVASLLAQHPGQVAALVMEAETVEPPAPGFFAGLRALCDEHGTLLVLDEIITGFRWHLRGAQHVHGIEPDLCTFGKGIANGLPLAALAGRRDLMRRGGFVDDVDRVWLLSLTAGGQPWALAAMLAVIDDYERRDVCALLAATGARLRRGFDEVVGAAGLADHLLLRGRDCNLVHATLDSDGRPSQELRTLVLQELAVRGVLAPSFVPSAAHDDAAVELTLEALVGVCAAYTRALEDGVGTVLRGRPVRPSNRARG